MKEQSDYCVMYLEWRL